MDIGVISGARPQFVKVAPLIREMIKQELQVFHIHTGQHYDYGMSQSFFDELQIPEPDLNLNVGSGSHGKQTAKMIEGLEQALLQHPIDVLIVLGDTNSTLAGAVVAPKLGIPLVHLEAGMRSHDWNMPEELNRILVDRVSNLLIISTDDAAKNLVREGYNPDVILRTGDIMVDSLYYARKNAKSPDLTLPEKYFLATLHRQENVDDQSRLQEAFEIFAEAPLPVILPIHPRTEKMLAQFGLDKWVKAEDNIIIIPPVGYLEFIFLQNNANGILTDSGGIQKEAFILRVPCITLRDTTEWVESVQLGANRRLGIDKEKVINALHEIVSGKFSVDQQHPYGDGRAAEKITAEILSRIEKGTLVVRDNMA